MLLCAVFGANSSSARHTHLLSTVCGRGTGVMSRVLLYDGCFENVLRSIARDLYILEAAAAHR